MVKRRGWFRRRRAVWLALATMLVACRAPAQDIFVRPQTGSFGGPEMRPSGEEIGRRAVRKAERELLREQRATHAGGPGADVLSDTQGVNFEPYLREMLREIYAKWILLIPAEARQPRNVAGTTVVRFRIDPLGNIVAMFLDGSSHDDALNRAAWGAIAGCGPFR